MAVLLLFGKAREAAGTSSRIVEGATVGEVLDNACALYGAEFGHVLDICKVWVNGEPARTDMKVGAADEVAVLPPVSGG